MPARIILNNRIIKRVLHDVKKHPEVEIGGRWIGHVYQPGQDIKLSGINSDDEVMTYVVHDYIPTGPNPEKSTDVELQPDRNYQLWTLRKLQDLDEKIEVLGSWHSHIPNGLQRYSRTDFISYFSKLNNEKNPYPFDGLLCSLIHSMPNNEEDTRKMLEHAWFPKGGEFGEHSWYDEERLTWANIGLSGEKYLDLDDFSPYLTATGTKLLTLDDWIETISFVAETTGYEDHQIKRSPNGEKILLLESMPSGTDYAVEINNDGNVFFIEKSDSMQRTNFSTVAEAMNKLEMAIRNETGLSARWSHVNQSLANALISKKEVPKKKGLFAWIMRR